MGRVFDRVCKAVKDKCTKEFGFTTVPREYETLTILHRQVGDVKIVDHFCYIWNHHNKGDTLRYKSDDGVGEIVITGKCADLEEALQICKLITCFGVQVRHEETRFTLDVEI